jgi:YesN/AraC family two-component response regulator
LESKYKIRKASDGVKGLAAALKFVPDLIISDVMMPNMDGIEFCKMIKEDEVTSHVPVILLTAKGSMEHRIEGLEVGADSYIPKPFDIRHLEVRIQKLLIQRETLRVKFTSGEVQLDSQKVGINKLEKDFLEKMEQIIEENLTNSEFGVEDLGEALGFSRMQLYRKLKSIRGLSANEFIREYRIKKAAVYLKETDMKIFEVLYEVGISNHSYFTKCFKQYFNKSPRDYIDEYRGK